MSSLARISRGLPCFSLFLLFWGTAALCAAAILLGRSAPGSAAQGVPRYTPAPPPVGINHCDFSGPHGVPTILDPETGAISPCTLPGARDLLLLGFSPWRDAEGQYQLIALQKHGLVGHDEGSDRSDESFGLTRYTYPAGRVLGQVPLDFLPWGAVCWLPDRSPRIVFASGDCRLCLCDLDAGRGTGRPDRPPVRPLRWQGLSPERDLARFQDPCWPAAPELGGRLIAAAWSGASESGSDRESTLAWLQVDPALARIESAGPLIVPEAPDVDMDADPEHEEERKPCVGRTRDGRLLLAYLGRARTGSTWDLWVAPISFDAATRAPRVVRSARRKLAEGCVGLVLAFSSDGQTIHVSMRDGSSPFAPGGRLRSIPVPAGL